MLDFLILRTQRPGPAHGHAVAKVIEGSSLLKRGRITVEQGTSNNRRAKFYQLTPLGQEQLVVETSKWDKIAAAIGRVLHPNRRTS